MALPIRVKVMFCEKKNNKLSNKQSEGKKVTLRKLLSMVKESRMQEKFSSHIKDKKAKFLMFFAFKYFIPKWVHTKQK